MNIFKKAYDKLFSTKSMDGNQLAILQEFSHILTLSSDYASLSKKGYIENVIANTCIRRTCEAMNDIPLKFFLDGKELEDGKSSNRLVQSIINSINSPEMDKDKELWLETLQSQIFIDGNGYVFPSETAMGEIFELELFRPDRITPKQGSDYKPLSYTYNGGTARYVFERNKWWNYKENQWIDNPKDLNGRFNMVIYKTFSPNDDMKGLSRLGSCSLSLDNHNGALNWNNTVMQNAGKSSGILTFGHNEAGSISEEGIKRISEKLKQQTTGQNRGSILVANAPGKFEKFSLTSQEMDFIEGTIQRAVEICNALDYPPYLLGLNGATFSNQDAAKLSLYENSAIPKTKRIYSSLSRFLNMRYGINFEIKCDISQVEAMAPRFEQKNANILKQYTSNVIKLNEARTNLGYEEISGDGELFHADFVRNQNNQPEG